MNTFTIVLLVIVLILIAVVVIMYFLGRRLEKRQAESQQALEAAKQSCTMLIIDKKKLRIKDSGLPQAVIDQTPWYAKRSKVSVVKCKVGPQILTMIADDAIFDMIPVKKEVKATVSGIYIMEVRGLRGPLPKPEAKKKGFRDKLTALYKKNKEALAEEENAKNSKKKKK